MRQYYVPPDGRFLMIRQGSAATDDATVTKKAGLAKKVSVMVPVKRLLMQPIVKLDD